MILKSPTRAHAMAVVVLAALFGCEKTPPTESPSPGDATALRDSIRRHAAETAPPSADPPQAGAWNAIAESGGSSASSLSPDEVAALEAIGYLGGYENVPAKVGVVQHLPDKAMSGYNLYTSGHAPEATLTDMQGRVLHTWQFDGMQLYDILPNSYYWRRVHLLDNGELLALFDPYGIIKLDRESKLLWATDGSLLMHHDIFVTEDNDIYVLGRGFAKVPELSETKTILEDYVVRLDQDGRRLETYSMREAFRDTPNWDRLMRRLRAHVRTRPGDHVEELHSNTMEVFDGSLEHLSPFFKQGNIMSCSPFHQIVWIIDGETRKVVWSWFGPWLQSIHDPSILETGNLLIFDNHHLKGRPKNTKSAAKEYDFETREEQWSYAGDPADPATSFFSATSSTAERLPNGNTLLVVTESGRAIEVTPRGEVVWEFFNPKRAGSDGEFIASLFQLLRLREDTPMQWLARAPQGESP